MTFSFVPVFYDIARTGRKLWVSIYFRVTTDTVSVRDIQAADNRLKRKKFHKAFQMRSVKLFLIIITKLHISSDQIKARAKERFLILLCSGDFFSYNLWTLRIQIAFKIAIIIVPASAKNCFCCGSYAEQLCEYKKAENKGRSDQKWSEKQRKKMHQD